MIQPPSEQEIKKWARQDSIAYGMGCGDEYIEGFYDGEKHLIPWLTKAMEAMECEFVIGDTAGGKALFHKSTCKRCHFIGEFRKEVLGE